MGQKHIINLLRVLAAVVVTTCLVIFPPWILIKAWVMPLPDSLQSQLQDATELGFEGIIVYRHELGKAPQKYAAGWKDSENKVPATPDALFKIASINKLYIAAAAAKLINDERLALDNTLAFYFPELAARIQYADQITLKMMLQHRSGIPNYTDTSGYWSAPPDTFDGMIALILDLPASFAPDQGYAYSNTNYLLLGALIDNTLGYSHQQYIQGEILTPLNLTQTFFSLQEVNIDDVMSGYYVGYDKDLKTVEQGMLATAEDVGIFITALNDGSLFSAQEQKIYSSIYVYDHTGLVPGYQSIARYHKDIDTVVVQFTNTTDFEGYNWTTSEIVYDRVMAIIRREKQQEN